MGAVLPWPHIVVKEDEEMTQIWNIYSGEGFMSISTMFGDAFVPVYSKSVMLNVQSVQVVLGCVLSCTRLDDNM
jgi:hypothetical protein